MNDQNMASTPQLDAINRVAERAYALRLPARWMRRTGPPWIAVSVASPFVLMLVNAFLKRPIDGILLVFLLPLLLPFLAVCIWMLAEQKRLREAFGELRGIFVPGHSDARQIAPPSAIGPLLEATLAAAVVLYDDEIESVAALLGALLQSIRAEDEVILTEFQRKRLHELVMPPGWDYWIVGTGGVCGKSTPTFETLRRKLRPAAIGALAVVGDSSSILVLKRFARKADDPALRQAALQSVEQIRERLRYGPEEMLRASRAPEHPDTLLRTVSPDKPQATDSQQLLRADNADAELLGKSASQQTEEQAASVANVVVSVAKTK